MASILRVDYLVVHTSATKPSMDIGVKEIDVWHKARKWKGIGYHFVIRRNGVLESGRSVAVAGAHVYGYNRVSLGICLVGGLSEKEGKPENNYEEVQMDTLHTLLVSCKQMYPRAEVVGHRDLSPDVDGDGIIEPWEWLKECPCMDIPAWWKAYDEYE